MRPADGGSGGLVTVYRNTTQYSTPYTNARVQAPLRATVYLASCEAYSSSAGPYNNHWWSKLHSGTWVNNGYLRGGVKMGLGDCVAPRDDAGPVPSQPAARTLRYQYQTQQTGYWCSAGAARIALSVRGKYVAQSTLARLMHVDRNGLPNIGNLRDALNRYLGGRRYAVRSLPSSAALRQRLRADVLLDVSHGYAVVINVVRIASAHFDGHYATIVGYRGNGAEYLIADPASSARRAIWLRADDVASGIKLRRYVA